MPAFTEQLVGVAQEAEMVIYYLEGWWFDPWLLWSAELWTLAKEGFDECVHLHPGPIKKWLDSHIKISVYSLLQK